MLLACAGQSDDIIAHGTVEIVQTDIAGLAPARILQVRHREGEWVEAGDTLVLLSQTGLSQDIEQRRARVRAAEAELRDLMQGARRPEIDQAAAELRSAESEAERTGREAERLGRLAEAGGISQSELDAARSAARVAASRRDAVREALELLQAGARPERIQAARAAVATAQSQLQMAEAAATDLVLVAPTSGVVLDRYVEPGEILPAGVPALSLGDPGRPWIRVYVSPAVFSAIKLGQRAQLTLDGIPGRSFEARVVALATRAEFTPRVALTEEERRDLLFAVKLDVIDTSRTVKAGLPATVRFDTAAVARGAESPPNERPHD
jgi:HlyD family secretion protein